MIIIAYHLVRTIMMVPNDIGYDDTARMYNCIYMYVCIELLIMTITHLHESVLRCGSTEINTTLLI